MRFWHLLSLDAPTVAAVWLVLLSPAQLMERAVQAGALALAVWLFYVGDRVLDATHADAGSLQARHRFHARHRREFGLAAAVALPILALLVLRLPEPVRVAWLWLALPMALYALAIHRWPVRRMPKELVVSAMFAVAVSLPALVGRGHVGAVCGRGVLLAAVCWANCVAIARWEGGGRGVASASTAWGARHLRELCASVALAGIALTLPLGPAALCCGLSAVLLLVLDSLRNRLDAVALRGLADACLLTPLLLLPCLLLPALPLRILLLHR